MTEYEAWLQKTFGGSRCIMWRAWFPCCCLQTKGFFSLTRLLCNCPAHSSCAHHILVLHFLTTRSHTFLRKAPTVTPMFHDSVISSAVTLHFFTTLIPVYAELKKGTAPHSCLSAVDSADAHLGGWMRTINKDSKGQMLSDAESDWVFPDHNHDPGHFFFDLLKHQKKRRAKNSIEATG